MSNQVIGYTRVSTNEQFTKGGSIQAQKNLITNFCQDKGLSLLDIYSEETSVSTKIPMAHRQEGSKVVSLMNDPKKELGIVLVKLDRAFRSTAEALTHINNWSKKKSVYILDFLNGQQFDSNDPMMKMTLSIMSAFAELERDTISKRTKVVLQDKKHNLEAYCSKVYGYQRITDSNQLIPHCLEQQVLHEIFQVYSQGNGLRKIAKYLNDKKYPTPTGAKMWYPSTISYILKNELYSEISKEYFKSKPV